MDKYFHQTMSANHGLVVDDIITNELSFHSDDEEAKRK